MHALNTWHLRQRLSTPTCPSSESWSWWWIFMSSIRKAFSSENMPTYSDTSCEFNHRLRIPCLAPRPESWHEGLVTAICHHNDLTGRVQCLTQVSNCIITWNITILDLIRFYSFAFDNVDILTVQNMYLALMLKYQDNLKKTTWKASYEVIGPGNLFAMLRVLEKTGSRPPII